MLPTKNRLRRQKDFQLVASKGKKFFSDFLMVKVLFKTEGEIKVGVVVPSKVSKKAVRRNQLRRWINEDIRRNLSKLPVGNYLILVKPEAIDLDHPTLTRDLFFLLDKIKSFYGYFKANGKNNS